MDDLQRKLLAAELRKKDEAENEALRLKAQEHKKKTGSFEGFFQPTKEELPNRIQIAKGALKAAMRPDKAEEDSPLGKLVKALKDKF